MIAPSTFSPITSLSETTLPSDFTVYCTNVLSLDMAIISGTEVIIMSLDSREEMYDSSWVLCFGWTFCNVSPLWPGVACLWLYGAQCETAMLSLLTDEFYWAAKFVGSVVVLLGNCGEEKIVIKQV